MVSGELSRDAQLSSMAQGGIVVATESRGHLEVAVTTGSDGKT